MSPLATSLNADKPLIFDLTSDTATVPTDEMFDIMKAATRGDDVYQVRCPMKEQIIDSYHTYLYTIQID